jgi:type IV fimbrial biogenesis protein FimT
MHKNHGVSLLELLLATALLAILLTLAMPAYKSLLATDRAATEVVQLVAAINFARSEAVKRRNRVTLCKSADGAKCGGSWSQGWLVFVDKKGDGVINSSDELLSVHQILKGKDQLDWSASHSNNYLQFDVSGNTHGQDGTFIYCSATKNPQLNYAIVVSQTGRARISKGKDADGKPLICNF